MSLLLCVDNVQVSAEISSAIRRASRSRGAAVFLFFFIIRERVVVSPFLVPFDHLFFFLFLICTPFFFSIWPHRSTRSFSNVIARIYYVISRLSTRIGSLLSLRLTQAERLLGLRRLLLRVTGRATPATCGVMLYPHRHRRRGVRL